MTAAPAPVSPNDSSTEEELHGSLLSAFAAVDDPRKPRGRRFPLPALLSLIVIALLAGCKNPTQIYNFAKARRNLLPRLGIRPLVKPRLEESRGACALPMRTRLPTCSAASRPTSSSPAESKTAQSMPEEQLGVPEG